MNTRIKHSLSLFLSVIILVSSNGVVLAAHSCFSKHETEVSLFRHKGCCSSAKKDCHAVPVGENAFAKKCCQLTITYHKVDVSSPIVRSFSLSNLNIFAADIFFFSMTVFSTSTASYVFNKAPPFISAGVSFLLSIHTLLI